MAKQKANSPAVPEDEELPEGDDLADDEFFEGEFESEFEPEEEERDFLEGKFEDEKDDDVAAEADSARDDEARDALLAEFLADRTVKLGGETFEIAEPDIGVTLKIVNAVGRIGLRGERLAARVIKNPTSRAAVFGMLAGLQVDDLHHLAAAVLQFENEKEGRKWLRKLGSDELKLAPIVRAFILNYVQSADLREALANFIQGQDLLEATLTGIGV
jgi:hypothetical protein